MEYFPEKAVEEKNVDSKQLAANFFSCCFSLLMKLIEGKISYFRFANFLVCFVVLVVDSSGTTHRLKNGFSGLNVTNLCN